MVPYLGSYNLLSQLLPVSDIQSYSIYHIANSMYKIHSHDSSMCRGCIVFHSPPSAEHVFVAADTSKVSCHQTRQLHICSTLM